MNKVCLSVLGLVFVVAGCERSTPSSAIESGSANPVITAERPAVARSKPVAAEAGDTGLEILLQRGVELPFRHLVGYDIKDVSRNGTPRRRVLVEVLHPDFREASESFLSVLREDGYTGDAASDESFSKRQETYVKEGGPTYYLLIQDRANGPRLSSDEATGSIHIMWNEG